MKKIKFTTLFLAFTITGFGQVFDSFLQSVELNNPRLKALQKWLEAEEALAKTGIYPDNPEVGYNYLFGNSNAPGNQQELEITQAFKLPGYYTSKADLQRLGFQQKQALADREKREILHTARTAYFNLVWLHKKEALQKNRKDDAEKLAALMQKGFESGEFSKPVYDKARIYTIGIQTDWQKIQSEIDVQKKYLMQLNGDKPVDGITFEYPVNWELPPLDSFLANLAQQNPDMLIAQLSIQKSEIEINNQRMNSLPTFEAGYRSESISGQKLKGFHAGVSIPLWQNKNTVQYARLNTETSKANYAQQESELKTKVAALYFDARALKNSYEQMKQIMGEEQVTAGSLELLQSGQISFSEYYVDAEFIWEMNSKLCLVQHNCFVLLSLLKSIY